MPSRISTSETPATEHSVVRVVVANDYDLVVNGVAAMLAGRAEVQLLGVSVSLADLRATDVVLLDTFGAPDACSRFETMLEATPARILVFSWSESPDGYLPYVARGAAGYLFKGATPDELVAALVAVSRGLPPQAVVGAEAESLGSWPGRDAGLSGREAEVLALIAMGLSNIEIGERLFLSVNTVKTYIRTGYRKIGVTNRSRAVIWAVNHGFRSASPDQGGEGARG